jgi:superfamily II DNA or RNA helicase
MKLEDLTTGTRVRGLTPDGVATVKAVQWFGDHGVEVIFQDAHGSLQQRIVYRDDEPSLDLVQGGRPWSFDGDGDLLRLVSEAYRIHLAWLFDPYLAVTTSLVDPYPHQISAVYEEMLPRQPMRFLLADDPGAGKTIMAGLLIRELMVRGDLERCLIVAPGSLTEQWQDELGEKFGLEFELLGREMITNSRMSNPFEDQSLLIARLDQLSRNEDVQERLKAAREWDLVVCDEAHRMSGHYEGEKPVYTKRYKLGEVVGEHCRNLLLMTATPHNGKEEDFHLFLALLDGDRFEGRYRDGVHTADPTDIMRRMVKEDLKKFDGSDLFPERRSYTVQYDLSEAEANLYSEVTDYVREEMNRAERFAEEGDQQRKVNVGFALMTLQRRLASSPEAIFKSIERRRERLESRLREERIQLRGQEAGGTLKLPQPTYDEDDLDELYDEAPQDEREEVENKLVDLATAAKTIEELGIEIERLKELEGIAKKVRLSAQDAKWNQLNSILDDPLMTDDKGARRKLVIFTEFKDTLAYLADRIRTRLGRAEAVVEIQGGVKREDRRKVVHAFMHEPHVLVLVANDAAGEGVNLQRAHLMVNYDLPWNPNRLEQRFGRIHRIGQEEVCHLWNLVAKDTREGDVYHRLLSKLDAERQALGGKVFDVLGQLFEQRALRDLLMEAIRYGNDPEVKARLNRVVDSAVDRNHLRQLLETRALVHDSMDLSKIEAIRDEMERAHARRLQPNYIQAFFAEAFQRLGGRMVRREAGRFEITHVPAAIRERDRLIGCGAPILKCYERVCFEKDKVDAQPRAHLICPGSPLLDATIDLVLERHGDVLKRGAVLIDESDEGTEPRLLFYLEHAVQDGRKARDGKFLVVSQQLQFVEVGADGAFRNAGAAPYLDYRAASEAERALLTPEVGAPWLRQEWEDRTLNFTVREVVPRHVEEVRSRRLALVAKVEQEVKTRLQREINFWDRRAQDLRAQEAAGKKTRLPAGQAQERADKLADRMKQRLSELGRERSIMPRPPAVKGGALVIPLGLMRRLKGEAEPAPELSAGPERGVVERLAMQAVMAAERALGRVPRDVSAQRGIGYDIESKDEKTGKLYFIEVKGIGGSDQVTMPRTEVLCALNEPDRFRLAIVLVEDDKPQAPVYVKGFDFGQPGFGQTSSSYSLKALLQHGGPPA